MGATVTASCSCGCPPATTEDLYHRVPVTDQSGATTGASNYRAIKDPAVHHHPPCHLYHRGRTCPRTPGLFPDKEEP